MNWQSRKLMLIGGGLLQVEAVRIAHELGLIVIVTDRDAGCACAKLADQFYQIDTKDVFEHFKLVDALGKNLAGVFTEGASVERTVARVADYAGLPGIPVEVANNIAEKHRMRFALYDSKISPVLCLIYDSPDYLKARNDWKDRGAFVVKAVDNSGSRGLTKCQDLSELTVEVFDKASQASSDGRVLIEELLEPDPNETIWEQSVETVWYNGEGYWLSWVDREFLPDNKYAIESNVYAPAMHSPQVTDAVIDMCLKAGKALGMTTGIFKCDTFLSDKGPRILETTARLSGGFDSQYLTPLAYGADYIRGAMLLALGEPIHWELFHPKWHRHAVAHWVFPKRGRVKALDTREAETFGKVFSRVKVGDEIKPLRACTDRSIVCIAASEHSREWAMGAANRMDYFVKKGLVIE